ncbi:primary-amine oxidase [Microbacterium endophyticum]|uniref:Amine oxidase n=1 Tax=Microbacterium endophyticum TaxID=1526412 RepID=A0A7W4V249_9MICO|nr:primary-amine oxidase [Microbacterium endophyticum]MBB2975344.1 primary-amine oxidase [Microbacterium endophyticum]NIK35637.1 primary-amine oxidase [Microbacterium endophyticum]
MTVTRHWSSPITPAEIDEISNLVKADTRIGEKPRFWGIAVEEGLARALADGQGRPVRLVVMNPDEHAAWEITGWSSGIDREASLSGWNPVDAKRPGVSSDEARMVSIAARNSPILKEALAKRGILDSSLVWVDPESITGFEPEDLADRRLSWGTVWHRESEDDNGYARPVAGLVPIIDLETLEVVRLEDHGVLPMASETGNYRSGTWGPDREVAPLEITQPEGPGFKVDGHSVTWQNWSFRIGFTHREGLVLHDIGYQDGDTLRPILRRAAINEMYVPYLDSDPTAYRKNFFDWGEYGAGPLTASLELGCDCLGEIQYFDSHYIDGQGDAKTIVNGICMHEEDDSILWKHVNTRIGESEVRRQRRLVISFFATVANYDYGFYWSLYQDGAIELEVKLTGILSVSGIDDGDEPAYGRMVAPNVQAPTHQHYFAIRMDTAIDGPKNRLVEVHAEVEEDETLNPYGNAVKMVPTTIASEKEAARVNDPSRAVHWRIESTDRTNRYGDATSFRLVLPNTTRLFARPGSVVERKAPFISKHLWATAYDASERFIAGEYPNQAPLGEEGITAWQEADRPLDGAELVVWPIVGVHHYVRPEDWPIMPLQRIGLRMEPDGFFDRNPALDVPSSAAAHCHAPAPKESAHGSTECHCH